ncbi:MAG: hypothetical protein DRQ48_03580 [Gammaproteobacteria bacterium]|nr:MAG: hypothetical protein DRQ58_11855 [Gammaproteobacteria bacterium]RKZ71439.1 MAG: hypothetical protein DRQ48_03580 [Gammaproteobacteria bacterium]
MNRVTAIALLLIGMLLFMGSCAPIGYVFYHEAAIDPAETVSLSGFSDEFTFQAIPNTLARFTVQANVSTASVQEDPESISDEYEARFKFPITYTVSDASGNILVSEDVMMAWKDGGSISKSNEETSSTGGTLTASTSLDKFTVPADGHVNINIELSPDSTYEASMAAPQLHLYGDMINNTWYITGGILMGFLGFVLAMVGFIFAVANSAQESIRQPALVQDITIGEGTRDKNINQLAMYIQLSAFAGYIIPLGSVIVPVILWMIWRDKDPYIDEMGREATNFQLSMILYYIISFVLCFIIIGFFLITAAFIFHIAFIITGSMQASRGVSYRYPMIIRFIKD